MNVFVVLVLVAVVMVLGVLALVLAGRGGFAAPAADPVRPLPPVLLPPRPTPADVGRLRFSPGLRGYRMDQVDETLQVLSEALAERDAEISRLSGGQGVISGTARNPE